MSEPIFSIPGQGAVPAMGAPEPDAGTSRKSLFIIGGVGAALILGAGAFFMLGSGASTPEPIAAGPVPAASVSPSESPAAAEKLPAASTVPVAPVAPVATAAVTTRDPFKPLFYVGGSSVASVADTTTTTPAEVPVAPPSVATVNPLTLTVSSIDPVAQTAVVGVDAKPYTVGVGVPFAKYFTVYSVFNANCVGVLFGDQSIPVCTTVPQSVSP
ncbi:unannotated protein [freshwater metagenome]|uniref:Unannotated protein n=1 Tax=freshwater metagenome TaxID=449393 RepID=A0A6J7R8G4_9ZZZZ|nr:hypothetical protein [Actinomycetota bacterium]MSW37050.1 hypothetical protein [Actinomycetota bacterium]